MNDQKPPKSNLFKKILVSITLLVDGVLFTVLGRIFLIFMAMLDPVGDDVNTKYENIHQGQIVYLLGLAMLVIFLLAAIFWSLTKRVGKYLAAGLCIFFVLAFSIAVLVLSPFLFTLEVIAIPLFILILAVIALNI
jgi:hypothetical protein